MKHKIFTFLLTLIASVGTTFAQSGTCGDNLTWELSSEGVLTISGIGDMGKITWGDYNEQIKKVIINDGVTSIGDSAFFSYYPNLTSVKIGNSVTSIGDRAFEGCPNLTSINIPNSVTSIGAWPFYGCDSLPVIDHIRYADTYAIGIGRDSWDWDEAPSKLTIKEGTRWIGYLAFYGCSSTYTIPIEIPNSVISIEEGAFAACSWFSEITIPNSVTNIGKQAFFDCRSLTSVTIGNSVKSIGDMAFMYCNLTSIALPKSVTSIGEQAFNSCNNLTSVICHAEIPPTCGSNAFNFNNFLYDYISFKLYVPAGSIDLYKSAEVWKEFGDNIFPIGAEPTEVTVTMVETDATTVNISWPQVNSANTYELVIKDKNGNIICTLVFNDQGQLISFAFHAPSQNKAPQQVQAAGFIYTVTGLKEGTTYDYILTAKNESGQVLKTEQGTFTTKVLEGLEDIEAPQQGSLKVLHEGQVYILRGDKTYTLQGQEVK